MFQRRCLSEDPQTRRGELALCALHDHTPVDLLLQVRGVAAATVGQQQPPVVQPVGVDLDVTAVHDEDERGWRLPGHLWGQFNVPT